MNATRRWATRSKLIGIAAIIAVAVAVGTAGGQTLPALPSAYVDTSWPSLNGAIINLPAGGNLQAAIDSAQPGDTILLAAGATYSGTFTLPVKSGNGWIVIRTSTPDASLPAPGNRITPSHAALLPKIVATSSAPAIQTAAGAHHYRLVGLEIAVASNISLNYGLVTLGTATQSSLTQVPSFIILDRVYIHGHSGGDLLRGVALNSASSAVVDSWISDVHFIGADSQAICGWNGPGPFKIRNNYLSGAGENVMFGGSDPDISSLVPSDIEIRGNYFYKPLSWKIGHSTYAGKAWTVKNLFELKNARRVLVDGNIFQHNWPHAQNGFSILFTVRNQDGSAPWSVVEDVTFTHNIVRHVAAAVNILGHDDLQTAQQTKRILIRNNVFEDVSAANWGGNGRLLQMLDGTADVSFDHNTAFQTGEIIAAAGSAHARFVYRNNLTPHNQYGVAGDNYYGNPAGALATYFPGAVFLRNVLQGGRSTNYPVGNFFPATMSEVLFTNLAGGDYRLQATSPYKNAGTDGLDVGADINAVNQATSGVLSGTTPGGGPPPPPDTTPPTVSISSPFNGATSSGNVTISANAADDVAVAGVRFYVDGAALGAEDTSQPYSVQWSTTLGSNGTHTLTATARDAAGNTATSALVSVNVQNVVPDVVPPSVSITSPPGGATVSGTVAVTAAASDDVGVAAVRFQVNGLLLGAEDVAAPYSVEWDTTVIANGTYALTAIARDGAGNSTTSPLVHVVVSNEVPGDRTPPEVMITAPEPGAVVSGVVQIAATATDDDAVAAVRFYANGSEVGSEANAVPYVAAWDSAVVPNGTYALTAAASDAAGNTATSMPVVVTVVNIVPDTTPPNVSVSSPAAGSAVAGIVDITAAATDDEGVAGVRFYIDGSEIAARLTQPFAVAFDTRSMSNGWHSLHAVAWDEAGNSTVSPSVAVEIANPFVPPPPGPYRSTPFVIPGRLEAEDFDWGGEGKAYHDTTPGNQPGFYRIHEDVDILNPGGSNFVIADFAAGEYLMYTIEVARAGAYRIDALVSSRDGSGRFRIAIDGVDQSGPINVPRTGSWNSFAWAGKGSIALSAGVHVVAIRVDAELFQLDSINFELESGNPPKRRGASH